MSHKKFNTIKEFMGKTKVNNFLFEAEVELEIPNATNKKVKVDIDSPEDRLTISQKIFGASFYEKMIQKIAYNISNEIGYSNKNKKIIKSLLIKSSGTYRIFAPFNPISIKVEKIVMSIPYLRTVIVDKEKKMMSEALVLKNFTLTLRPIDTVTGKKLMFLTE